MKTKRILIIDDEAGFTEMVKLNLEATGNYEVCVENHLPQAVPARPGPLAVAGRAV